MGRVCVLLLCSFLIIGDVFGFPGLHLRNRKADLRLVGESNERCVDESGPRCDALQKFCDYSDMKRICCATCNADMNNKARKIHSIRSNKAKSNDRDMTRGWPW